MALAGADDAPGAPMRDEALVLRGATKTHRVGPAEIRYLKADHVYVEYHLADGTVLHVRETLREATGRLDPTRFVRCHRSYAVNLAHVRALGRSSVTLDGGAELPVSRSRREALRAAAAPDH